MSTPLLGSEKSSPEPSIGPHATDSNPPAANADHADASNAETQPGELKLNVDLAGGEMLSVATAAATGDLTGSGNTVGEDVRLLEQLQPHVGEMNEEQRNLLQGFASTFVALRSAASFNRPWVLLKPNWMKWCLIIVAILDSFFAALQIVQAFLDRTCEDHGVNDGPLIILLLVGCGAAAIGLILGVLGTVFDNRGLILFKLIGQDVYQAYVSLYIMSRYSGAFWAEASMWVSFITIAIEMAYQGWLYYNYQASGSSSASPLKNRQLAPSACFWITILAVVGAMGGIYAATKSTRFADVQFTRHYDTGVRVALRLEPRYYDPQRDMFDYMAEGNAPSFAPIWQQSRYGDSGTNPHGLSIFLWNGTMEVDTGRKTKPDRYLYDEDVRCFYMLDATPPCGRFNGDPTSNQNSCNTSWCPACPVTFPYVSDYQCWNLTSLRQHGPPYRSPVCLREHVVQSPFLEHTFGSLPDLCFGPMCYME